VKDIIIIGAGIIGVATTIVAEWWSRIAGGTDTASRFAGAPAGNLVGSTQERVRPAHAFFDSPRVRL
jgi:hypothetical protein